MLSTTASTQTLTVSGNFGDYKSERENSNNNNNFEWAYNSYRHGDSFVFDAKSPVPAREVPCKVILIGNPGVGKTSYVQRYINKRYHEAYKWTVGVDFALKVIKWNDEVTIKLQLWDIAGQERFTSMTRVYYRDAHACIIMFDLTQRNTFMNARTWKKDLDSKCTLPDGSPVPCILLANKCDLNHREVEQAEIEQFCKEQEFIGWTETSVKQGLMIEESMKFLLEDMVSRYDKEESQDLNDYHSSSIHLASSHLEHRPKEGKCSCTL